MNLVSRLLPFDVKQPETSLSELCGVFCVLLVTYDNTWIFLLLPRNQCLPRNQNLALCPLPPHGQAVVSKKMPLAITANSQVAVTPFSPYSILSVCLRPRPLTLYPSVPLPPTPPPISFRSHQWNPFPMHVIKKMTTTKKKMKRKKKLMAYKKIRRPQKNYDSIFATPAPRPPIDARIKFRGKNQINEGDSLNQSPASDTASSHPTDMLSLHDSLVHDGPGVSSVEACLKDSTSNASARDLDDPRHAFTSPSPNHTPPKPSNMKSDKGPNEAFSDVVMSP